MERSWAILTQVCFTRFLDGETGLWLVCTALLASLHCSLFYPQVLICRLNSMNLAIYLCCCVCFAVVSKEKVFEILQPCLSWTKGKRIVFLICLCVLECWMLPANQTRTRIWEWVVRVGGRGAVNPGCTEQGQGWKDLVPAHSAIPLRGQRKTSDK